MARIMTLPHGHKAYAADREVELAWLRAEHAKVDLIEFACRIDPTQSENYRARHLRIIADKLEAVERGECTRLHITSPPRHWKTSTAVEKFALYYLARNPLKTVAVISHSASNALDFSRTIRNTIMYNPLFQSLFPDIKVNPNQTSAGEWALEGSFRASLVAMSTGSSPTGRGFHLIAIDDPTPDVQAAYSKNERDRQWAWYREVLRDRLEPGGALMLIMSRWHQDDLAGRLLRDSAAGSGEPWEVIHLKALNEAGEALWPERWSRDELLRVKQAQGSRAFAARFQGEPKDEEGGMLNPSKLRMIDIEDVPQNLERLVRRWDLAFSDKDGADYSAGAKMGVDRSGNRYILHIRRVRGKWIETVPVIRQIAETDGVGCSCAIEANGSQLGYAQEMKQRIQNRVVLEDRPEGNKEMRAALWGSRLDDGIIYCVRGEWNQEFFDEMAYFPNGEHDDMVDAVSGAWNLLGINTGSWSSLDIAAVTRPRSDDGLNLASAYNVDLSTG